VLGVVGSNLTICKLEPTAPNMSRHIATRWPNACNMLRPTLLRYVALLCGDRLAGASHFFEERDFLTVNFSAVYSPGFLKHDSVTRHNSTARPHHSYADFVSDEI